MQSREWSLSAVYEAIAAAVPDRDMLVWKDTRRTYAEVAARTRNLAAFLARRGLGVRRERAMVEDWDMRVALGRAGTPRECGDVIAFLLSERASYLTGALVNVDGGTDF